MVCATFRFYEELNDFLAPALRQRAVARRCPPEATTKHMIEAFGVPHTEVELILVNGQSVGFGCRLREGDRVSVYPVFESLDITPLLRVRERPLRVSRFIADAHLGALARRLRLLGFDTRFDNHFADATIAHLSVSERRIVLTRDRELLKRREITHGCYVHALAPDAQCREIVARLDLAGSARPFSLCLACNTPLRPLDRTQARDRVPEGVAARFERFATCDACRRVFWEGSHWARMRARVHALLEAPAGADAGA
jgi:uncharacterized protein with PIN domain